MQAEMSRAAAADNAAAPAEHSPSGTMLQAHYVSNLAPGLQAAAFYQYEDCPDSDEEMEVGLGSTSDAEASTMSEKRVCRAPDLDDVSSATGSAWEAPAGKLAGTNAAGGVSLLMQDKLLCHAY